MKETPSVLPQFPTSLFVPSALNPMTMTELAEGRAKVGFCPKCQCKSLTHMTMFSGLRINKCQACDCVVALYLTTSPT